MCRSTTDWSPTVAREQFAVRGQGAFGGDEDPVNLPDGALLGREPTGLTEERVWRHAHGIEGKPGILQCGVDLKGTVVPHLGHGPATGRARGSTWDSSEIAGRMRLTWKHNSYTDMYRKSVIQCRSGVLPHPSEAATEKDSRPL